MCYCSDLKEKLQLLTRCTTDNSIENSQKHLKNDEDEIQKEEIWFQLQTSRDKTPRCFSEDTDKPV